MSALTDSELRVLARLRDESLSTIMLGVRLWPIDSRGAVKKLVRLGLIKVDQRDIWKGWTITGAGLVALEE